MNTSTRAIVAASIVVQEKVLLGYGSRKFMEHETKLSLIFCAPTHYSTYKLYLQNKNERNHERMLTQVGFQNFEKYVYF